MKHILYFTTILLVFLTGCKKAPVNSDVEGYWRMKHYTILSTEETVECYNMFYGISHMVTEVSGHPVGAYVCRTEYRDNETKLVFKDFKVRQDTSDSGENAPVESLREYGIDSQQETVFSIEHCDGKHMTLQSGYARIELEKF